MMRLAACLMLIASDLLAETVVANRTIRPQQILTEQDIRLEPGQHAGAFSDIGNAVGMEARVAIYPGRPVMRSAVGEPALIERNQAVELVYRRGGLRIVTEGRALGRGGSGERVRVMNLASRSILFGTIQDNGTILVSQ